MSKEFYVLLATIFSSLLILAIFIKRWLTEIVEKKAFSQDLLEWLKSTNLRQEEQTKNFSYILQNHSKTLNERLDNAAKIIGAVQKNIGEMSEIGRGMKELQEFLRSPKLRGNIGEQVLKELLTQMLPKQSFHLQYSFKSGAIVDAAIKTINGVIPIDAKFPLENFRKMNAAKTDAEKVLAQKEFARDVKRHMSDISAKYILTDEGTIDYALMYIPSEAVYYEVINDSELYDYAASKRVLPVSPMTFYAYMRAILMSFEGQKIEERAKEILKTIKAVQKDYGKVEESLGVLGRHLTNAYNQMNNVLGGFTLLGQKLKTTQSLGEKTQEDVQQLEIEP